LDGNIDRDFFEFFELADYFIQALIFVVPITFGLVIGAYLSNQFPRNSKEVDIAFEKREFRGFIIIFLMGVILYEWLGFFFFLFQLLLFQSTIRRNMYYFSAEQDETGSVYLVLNLLFFSIVGYLAGAAAGQTAMNSDKFDVRINTQTEAFDVVLLGSGKSFVIGRLKDEKIVVINREQISHIEFSDKRPLEYFLIPTSWIFTKISDVLLEPYNKHPRDDNVAP